MADGIYIFRGINGEPRRLVIIAPSVFMGEDGLLVDDDPPFYIEIPDGLRATFKNTRLV